VCASTLVRIFRGLLALAVFYIAGERFLTSGIGLAPVLLSLLGLFLGWQALTGGG
jgi:hydrogenase-4 membrane subunit HyfE